MRHADQVAKGDFINRVARRAHLPVDLKAATNCGIVERRQSTVVAPAVVQARNVVLARAVGRRAPVLPHRRRGQRGARRCWRPEPQSPHHRSSSTRWASHTLNEPDRALRSVHCWPKKGARFFFLARSTASRATAVCLPGGPDYLKAVVCFWLWETKIWGRRDRQRERLRACETKRAQWHWKGKRAAGNVPPRRPAGRNDAQCVWLCKSSLFSPRPGPRPPRLTLPTYPTPPHPTHPSAIFAPRVVLSASRRTTRWRWSDRGSWRGRGGKPECTKRMRPRLLRA